MRRVRIDYDHEAARGAHTVEGAREALLTIFPNAFPRSVLDLGCGTGTWLAAALECGATEVLGVDGAHIAQDARYIDEKCIWPADLNDPLDLGRKFELVLCLETAEHLESCSASTVVDSIVRHGDQILFSAAVPRQGGTHHVNCQWPSYWQRLFNERGFVCSDAVRWAIWNNDLIEPWYRQNLMLVERDNRFAGNEPRIPSVLHPGLVDYDFPTEPLPTIEQGSLPMRWYLVTPLKAVRAKLRRALRRKRRSNR